LKTRERFRILQDQRFIPVRQINGGILVEGKISCFLKIGATFPFKERKPFFKKVAYSR
jgi:hypothetical protein